MRRIYLDHAATTYLDNRVKAAMDVFWQKDFGNPSSIHKEGCDARNALTAARKKISFLISATPDEIVFTNGGTESDNLAIFGVVRAAFRSSTSPGKTSDVKEVPTSDVKEGDVFPRNAHIITSKIEHHAVLNSCEELERRGFEVTYLNVSKEGIVDLKELKKSLRPNTILVSIMYANNEIGTIQPIKEISKIIRDMRRSDLRMYAKVGPSPLPLFHTDAIQAAGYLDMNVQKLGVDLMSVNASKIYGPKGAGFLYIRRGVKILPIIYGGGQERGLRPGTENMAGISGLAEAFEIAQKTREKESKRLGALRDYMIKNILAKIPDSDLNGHSFLRLSNNANITIRGVEGESLVLYLDAAGVACSTGSACTSASLEPSHVLIALGKSKEDSHCSIRFTLGRKTTKPDIDYVLKILPEIVKKLRKYSAI